MYGLNVFSTFKYPSLNRMPWTNKPMALFYDVIEKLKGEWGDAN